MPKRGKLAWRITFYNTAFALLACFALALASSYLLRQHITKTAGQELVHVAELVASQLDADGPLPPSMRVRTLSRMLGADIAVLAPSGLVVSSSSRAVRTGDQINLPTRLLPGHQVINIDDRQYIYGVAPLNLEPGARVLAISETKELRAVTSGIMGIFIPISLLVALASSYFGALWTNRISLPLYNLEQTAHRIARGDYSSLPASDDDDEIGELTRALSSMARQLQRGEQVQRQFVQNASHELKTPLMNIQGYAEAVRDGLYEGDEANHCLDIIRREAVGMRQLVDDMIYLTKVTDANELLMQEEIRLGDLLLATEESTRGLVLEQNLQLHVNPAPDAKLIGDFDKLVRALTNLVANASRYASSQISIQAWCEKNLAVIEVRDDGPGIDVEFLPKIFERFSTGKKGLTGLGLAIAKAIVLSHSGTIAATNDNGAVFTIILPLV